MVTNSEKIGPHSPHVRSLHVRGRISKFDCTWLIDTGAMVTCVSASLPGISSLTLAPATVHPIAANQTSLKSVGMLSVSILIGTVVMNDVQVLVVEGLSAPAILGNDVLASFKSFRVDYSERVLYLGGFRVPLEERRDGTPLQPVSVRLISDFTAEPFSERVVYAQAEDFGSIPRDVMFDPDPRQMERYGVSISPCLARSGLENRIPILVKNPGPDSVHLYGHSTLGMVEDVPDAPEKHEQPRRVGPVLVDLEGAEISEAGRRKLKTLFEGYRDVFANSDDELGRTHLAFFGINTGDSSPVVVRPRRTPYHLRPEVRRQIADMEARGLIQRSISPWSSPILMVKKADGSFRFAVDFRALNSKTVDEVYYLPSVKECLDSLAGSSLFTTLDLNSAYWQVPMAPKDQKKTAFTTEDGKWEFRVMPFGAKGAPACFSRLIAEVLQGLIGNGVTAYLDDIIVGGNSESEHMNLLQAVLEKLRCAGLTVKSTKVVPCRRRIKFLGHVVSAAGLEPDEEKVEIIKSWPRPQTTKQLRQFLGLCNYYNDFVPHLQVIAAPLHEVSGKTKFQWDERKEKAFQELKRALGESTLLHLPDLRREFEVSTDASDFGLGCVLSQRDRAGVDRPVSFASRAFSSSEKNWHIRDKEVFAFVFALRKFRPYLLGMHFKWFTDHSGLQWLHNTRDPRGRYARWVEELSEFDFSIHFRRAENNRHADALSRVTISAALPAPQAQSQLQDQSSLSVTEMRGAQEQDKVLGALRMEVCLNRVQGPHRRRWQQRGFEPVLDRDSGLLVVVKAGRRYTVVPDQLIPRVLRLKHDEFGHFGAGRTCQLLKQAGYLWWDMGKDVKNYCNSCLVCARSNTPRRLAAPLEMTTQPTAPWQHIAVDLVGPFGRQATERGNRYVLVTLDLLTKGVELVAIPDKSAETVANSLIDSVVYRHGLPESILTDRGLEFNNQHLALVAQTMGIDKKLVSAFHPESNGAVERANQTIGALIRRNVQESGCEWDKCLSVVQFQYMSAPHNTTGRSPFFLQFGREPHTPLMQRPEESTSRRSTTEQSWAKKLVKTLKRAHEDVVQRETKKKQERVEASRKKGSSAPYRLGERVFMKIPQKPGQPGKVQPRWDGPFIVIGCRQGNTYRIKREDNFRHRFIRHFNQLKPVERRQSHLTRQVDREQEEGAGEQTTDDTARQPRLPDSLEIWDSDSDLDESEDEEGHTEAAEVTAEQPTAARDIPHPLRRTARRGRPPERYGEWTV